MLVVEYIARVLREIADRYYGAVALALVFFFAVFGPHIFPLKVNNTLATLLEQDTPQEKIDQSMKKVFGDLDEISILVYHDEELFTVPNLRLIVELTKKINAVQGVKNCFSLASTPFFRNTMENGEVTLHTSPLLEIIPEDPEALSQLKKDALGNQLFVRNIISPDGNTAAFNIIFQPDQDPFKKEAIIQEIRRLAGTGAGDTKGQFYFTGMHVFMESTGKTMMLDVELFSVLSLVLLFFALLFIFRNFLLAGIGLLAALVANGLLFATLHILGRNLSISTTPVPAITMGLALAYTLHVLVAKHEGTLDDPEEAQEIFVGALFSGLTSFIGFLTLCLNPIPTLQDFGLFAAIGTFFAGWTALFVSYPLLKLVHHRAHPRFARRFKFLLRLATTRFRKTILVVSLVFLAAGGLVFRMEVQTDYYQYYLKSSPMTKAVDFVNKTVGGQYPIVVEIDTGQGDGVYQENLLRFLEKFKSTFEKVRGVDKVITYLDLLNEGHKAFSESPQRNTLSMAGTPHREDSPPRLTPSMAFGGHTPHRGDSPRTHTPSMAFGGHTPHRGDKLPSGWYADSRKVSQVAMLVHDANVDLNGYYVDSSAQKTLIFVRTSHINSASFIHINQSIQDFMAREMFPQTSFTPLWGYKVGGTYLRCVNSADHMAISQFEGTFWEIIVLFSVAFLIIRSFRLTIIAFLANLVPIFGVYGLLSLLGETLNMGTTTIAAVSLGIGVDDTIHFVVRYITAFHKYRHVLKSTRAVIRSSSMSMFLAASMIALSFLSLAFSNIKPIYQLGVFTVVTMALCFAANMLLVPVLITMWERDRPQGTKNRRMKDEL